MPPLSRLFHVNRLTLSILYFNMTKLNTGLGADLFMVSSDHSVQSSVFQKGSLWQQSPRACGICGLVSQEADLCDFVV